MAKVCHIILRKSNTAAVSKEAVSAVFSSSFPAKAGIHFAASRWTLGSSPRVTEKECPQLTAESCRTALPHLTPALSAPGGGEGDWSEARALALSCAHARSGRIRAGAAEGGAASASRRDARAGDDAGPRPPQWRGPALCVGRRRPARLQLPRPSGLPRPLLPRHFVATHQP